MAFKHVHWSTLVLHRGNWVVTFPCSVNCSVDLSLSSGNLWLSQTMTRHLGQHSFKDGPDAWWRMNIGTYSTKLFTPAEVFIKQQKPPQTTIRVQVVSKEGCLFKLLMIPPPSIFGEQIFKMLVTKHSCKQRNLRRYDVFWLLADRFWVDVGP